MLLEAHKYLAFSYAKIADNTKSGEHFRLLLKIKPRWKLNPEDSSPEIDQVLITTKKDMAKEAGMCSCFIPGIGQIMEGDNKKGIIMMTTSSAALLMSLASWIVTDNNHHYYLRIGPNDTCQMYAAYNRYNAWYRASLASTAVFLGVYIYNICDAFSPKQSYKSAGLIKKRQIFYALNGFGWRFGGEIRF